MQSQRTLPLKSFFSSIQKAFFLRRPNRFVVECTLDGRKVRAYLPNPGRLWELLLPGILLYLVKKRSASAQKTDYTVVAVERRGAPVFLHTHLTNRVARYLIEADRVPGLEGYRVVKPEYPVGKSRFDFLLAKGKKEYLLEVKSCTLFGERIAMFPDAVTARGKRHVEELAHRAGNGRRGGVLFVVHSHHVESFLPEYHTDLAFANALCHFRKQIGIRAVGVTWREDLTLGREVRSLTIPWKVVEKEAKDRGSYLVILRLREDQILEVGRLGKRSFSQGYYLYVGSAMKNLSRRIDRHRRRRKKFHWHIDYFRDRAEWVAALPVRSSVPLECRIAESVGEIAEWKIPGFGSSDCACPTHLFGMKENPLHSPTFMEVLLYFRMDRLGDLLFPKEGK